MSVINDLRRSFESKQKDQALVWKHLQASLIREESLSPDEKLTGVSFTYLQDLSHPPCSKPSV